MDDPAALASSLKLALCICPSGCEARTCLDDLPLYHALIRLLAAGRPLSDDEIAQVTGLSPELLSDRLAKMDLDYDAVGRVIGAGLTLGPTPHRFAISGRQLFTWCALDALMYPALLSETVHVESPCRTTGQPVRVTVTPDGVTTVDPPEAVVSLVLPEPSQPPRQAFCGEVHFFASAQAAESWLATRPQAQVVPVETAYTLGKLLIARRGA
ncbi:MAG: organomercurial lyase MerB [Anaerolineales bacterium]|nr:organomercurial lyase MerB [Anaerolineales bacterium]